MTIQKRVIGALMVREMHTRYGRENIGFLWIVGEPVIFCVGVAIMWSTIHPGYEHNIPVVGFIITGYNCLTLWRHCVGRSVKAFEANGSLLFHRQVSTLDILFSRLLVEIAGSTVGFAVTGGGAILLGYMNWPENYEMLFTGWLMVAYFSIGTGMILAGASEMSDMVERFLQVVTYVSIPLSGAFTMTDWLPQKYQQIVLYSPSVNAFEMVRGGWFGPTIRPHFDLQYTIMVDTLMVLVGLYVTRAARKYVLVI